MSAPCEVRGILGSKQGLSCAGYYALSAQTAHLRERVYVWIRDGEKVFLPRRGEWFPVAETEAYYEGRLRLGWAESIGAGGGEVLFGIEGPASDEAATLIEAALPALEELLNRPVAARYFASLPYKYRHFKALQEGPPPYRPPCRHGPVRRPPPPRRRGQTPRSTPPAWRRPSASSWSGGDCFHTTNGRNASRPPAGGGKRHRNKQRRGCRRR